jgi:hypothetical protein
MTTEKVLINKVAQKAIVTLDLENYFPKEEEMMLIDMKEFLFKGLILREADFREQVKNTVWNNFQNKYAGIYCSTDAIIPFWAYMIIAAELTPFAKCIVSGALDKLPELFLQHNLGLINLENFENQRVIIKGCGDKKIDSSSYVFIAQKLALKARSIMYGEPCSTVPVYKKEVQ